jgi:DNA-binding MarR family transcriptional regulator
MTGILDRLERGGWIARERDVNDRRAIVIRVLPERNREMYRLYAGMDSLMDEICDGYDNDELKLITEFFRRVTGAGEVATERFEA